MSWTLADELAYLGELELRSGESTERHREDLISALIDAQLADVVGREIGEGGKGDYARVPISALGYLEHGDIAVIEAKAAARSSARKAPPPKPERPDAGMVRRFLEGKPRKKPR